MLEPSINVLREKADSRYSLVIMAAKRARDLVDGKPSLLTEESGDGYIASKPVSIAVSEIAQDLISYTRGKEAEAAELADE